MIKPSKTSNWNFGKISRQRTEQLLLNESIGTFLVRESEHFPGDLTLSIKDDNRIQHYRIKFDLISRSYTIDDESFFSDLHSLVQHYEYDADGLCCRLENALSEKYDITDSVRSQRSAVTANIDYKELQIGKLVGSGEFAEVYEGIYRKIRVAIKILKESNSTELFLREANIMNSLKHRNLVQLLGVAQKSDTIYYLITEFMGKGSLLHYLTTRGRSIISQRDLIGFSFNICAGLVYLEENHIVHRDIAASNVLIADDNTAKISDFGLAKFLDINEKENGYNIITEKIKCRTKWTAPEALESKRYTHKSDMWSFGILLWEMFSYGRCPYPRLPADEVLINLKEGYRMEPPEGCPIEIGDIMRQAWNINPDRRLSFIQVYQRLQHINI